MSLVVVEVFKITSGRGTMETYPAILEKLNTLLNNLNHKFKPSKWRAILKHPLFVGICGFMVFAVISNYYGQKLQYENWLKQNDTIYYDTLRAKLFEGRRSVAKELSFVYMMMLQTHWQIFNSKVLDNNDRIGELELKLTDLFGRSAQARQDVFIYFEENHTELIKDINDVEAKLSAIRFSIRDDFTNKKNQNEMVTSLNTQSEEFTNALANLMKKLSKSTVDLLKRKPNEELK